MKHDELYQSTYSPNSRRVRIFLAEKEFSFADIIALVTVDFAVKAVSFSVSERSALVEALVRTVSSRSSMAA
jgi:glutathione S-transferase